MRGFLILYFCLICLGMGRTIMFSILPPIGREMGLSEIQVASIFAINAGAWVVFSPFWGRKSDIWGRRRVMLIGLLGYAVSLFAVAGVTEAGLAKVWPLTLVYPMLIFARLIFGLVGSGAPPAAQAYVSDRTTPDERAAAMSRFAGALGFGSIIGPAFGGLLVVFGFLTPIYFVGLMVVVSGFLVWRFLPERRKPSSFSAQKKISFYSPKVVPFVLGNLTFGVGMAIGQQVVAYYCMDVFSMSAEEGAKWAGFALMATAALTLATQMVIIPRLSMGPGQVIKIGFAIIVAAFFAMSMAQDLVMLIGAMGVLGIGYGLAIPSIIAAASLVVEADRQGAVAGVLNSALAAGNIVGAVAGVALYQYSVAGPYLLAAFLCSIYLLYALMNSGVNVEVSSS